MDHSTFRILQDLREAAASSDGGEVVLRSSANTGRVFFHGGRVAWVVASTTRQTFLAHLTEVAGLTREDLDEVLETCKRTGDNFGETIVEWGLLDEATLRGHLLDEVSRCLLEILLWPEPNSMFVPETRPYKGNLTFELSEVLQRVLELDTGHHLPFADITVEQLLEQADRQAANRTAAPHTAADTPDDEPEGDVDREPPMATAEVFPVPRGPAPSSSRRWIIVLLPLLAAGGTAGYFVLRHRSTPPVVARPDSGPTDLGRPDLKPTPPDAGPPDAGHPDARPPDAVPSPGGIIVTESIRDGVGAVQISSHPSRALIVLDGLVTGRQTPYKLTRVESGVEHVIQVDRPGYCPTTKRFKLAAGMQAMLNLTLRRTHARPAGTPVAVRFVTRPEQAQIRVNGRALPQPTPFTVELDPRRISRVTLRKVGFRPWHRRIKPPLDVPLTFEIKLRPASRRQRRRQ